MSCFSCLQLRARWVERVSSRWESSGRRLRPIVEELEERVVPTLLGQSLFPADYPTNNPIIDAPVSASSAAWISAMAASRSHLIVNWGAYTPGSGGPLYSMPYNVVHSKDTANYAFVKVYIDNYPSESDLSGTNPSQGNRPYVLVPMPKVNPQNMVIEGDSQNGPDPTRFTGGGSDSHLIVWDADTNTDYELWETSRPNESSAVPGGYYIKSAIANQWNAANEATWNMSADTFRTLGYTSADAAGLPILNNIVRPDEVLTAAQGGQSALPAIDHALRFTLTAGLISKMFSYPASHVAAGGGGIPYGTRFRLKSDAATNALIAQMGPESQVIARALQQYGLILADIGSSMFVQGDASAVDSNNNPIIDPTTGKPITWNMNDLTPDAVSGLYTVGLDSIPTTDFEAVDMTPLVTGLSASSGLSGNTITVIGANFSGSGGHLSVLFVPAGNNPPFTSTPAYPNSQTTTLNPGVVAATSVTFVDDQHLQVVVPNGLSGTVDIQVLSGQLLDDTYNSDAENAKAPIFGYGISAQNANDKFTFNATGVAVHPATLSDWTINKAGYNSTVSASGGTAPYTFAVTLGNLPTGLSLNSSTGAITGTPTATGKFAFTITATDKTNTSGSNSYLVTINAVPTLTTSNLAPGTDNQPGYSQVLTTTGGTGALVFALTVGQLPTGLSLNAATGAITGTPTATGTFNFTISVADALGVSTSKAQSIVINAAAAPAPPPSKPSTPPSTSPAPPSSSSPKSSLFPPSLIATGADAGGGPQITIYNSNTATVQSTFYGLPSNFTGGARIAMDDVNGDGVLDYVVAAGPGAAPQITIFDGRTLQPIRSFYALPQSFTGGAFVACADVNGDGSADIIVAADTGGGPQVTIWSGKDGSLLASFYATTPTFTGGIRVAAADLNGNGFADVIAVAGPGGGPQVTIFDGRTMSVVGTFYAVAPTFTGGLYVAAGDVNGDGKADIVVGAGAGGGPQVTVFDGPTLSLLKSFDALAPSFTGGVRVGVTDVSGQEAIVAAAGSGGGPQVAIFDSSTLALLDSFYATTPSFTGGIFVA